MAEMLTFQEKVLEMSHDPIRLFDAVVEKLEPETPERAIGVHARSYAYTVVLMLPDDGVRYEIIKDIYRSMLKALRRYRSSVSG